MKIWGQLWPGLHKKMAQSVMIAIYIETKYAVPLTTGNYDLSGH